jgi:hypothetical protein
MIGIRPGIRPVRESSVRQMVDDSFVRVLLRSHEHQTKKGIVKLRADCFSLLLTVQEYEGSHCHQKLVGSLISDNIRRIAELLTFGIDNKVSIDNRCYARMSISLSKLSLKFK